MISAQGQTEELIAGIGFILFKTHRRQIEKGGIFILALFSKILHLNELIFGNVPEFFTASWISKL